MTCSAVQFPGLGGYSPGVFRDAAQDGSRTRGVLKEVDRAAREYGVPPVSVPLTDQHGPDIEEVAQTPARLHLASLATGLALYGELAARGTTGDVLLGHSTGELAALAAAGCLSVYDAARVLCEREIALAEEDFGGGLTALRISARRAGHLCEAVGGWTLRPSLFNAPRQTVVSGSAQELPRLEKAARALGIQVTRLLVIYPHHNPMLAAAARQVAEATATYRIEDPRVQVFSPLLGRLVRDTGDVREIIGRHLIDPVHYLEAVRELYADHDVRRFLEAGPRPLLTECAAECLPLDVELLGPPPGGADAQMIMDALCPANGASAPPRVERSAYVGLTGSISGNGVGPVPAAPVMVVPAAPVSLPTAEPALATARTGPAPAGTGRADEAGPRAGDGLPERTALVAELRGIFAEALGYPEEVFTEEAHLEADLGIASVKKTELLVNLLDRYDLPTPSADLRMRDYNTLPLLADLMLQLAGSAAVDGGEQV